MAEKYPWLSPYLYCANNPVNLVDPSGMIWEDPEEIERLIVKVKSRIENLQAQNTSYELDLTKNVDLSDNERIITERFIDENQQKIILLESNLNVIDQIGNDKDNIFSLTPVDKNIPHNVVKGEDGIINIQASSDSMALHEITHIGQSYDKGGLTFKNNQLINASKNIGGIVRNEILAYRTQFAMDQNSMPIPIISINSIDGNYLKHITNSLTGLPLYNFIK